MWLFCNRFLKSTNLFFLLIFDYIIVGPSSTGKASVLAPMPGNAKIALKNTIFPSRRSHSFANITHLP